MGVFRPSLALLALDFVRFLQVLGFRGLEFRVQGLRV